MNAYEQTLLAYGIDPATARRDAHVNEVRRLVNREMYAREQTPPEPIQNYDERRGV